MGRIDTFRILYPNLRDGFSTLLDEELDSWFSAEIACCSECYDRFLSIWPLVYLREVGFQESGIDIEHFYSGSRMHEVFTKDEFKTYMAEEECPRCGAPLTGFIWPYSFRFKVPYGFEQVISEIGQIGEQTPFLVLEHEFAKRVLQEIKRVSPNILPAIPPEQYRGRRHPIASVPSADDFLPPPPREAREGRYDHAGMPVLYLANDKCTCSMELGSPANGINVASVKILRPLKVLDLHDEGLEDTVLTAVLHSSLLSAPAEEPGWHQPQYVFSRFVADCVRASGIDAIKYPSVLSPQGDNLVLFSGTNDWKELVQISDFGTFTECEYCYKSSRGTEKDFIERSLRWFQRHRAGRTTLGVCETKKPSSRFPGNHLSA